jgi:peptidoglycan/xylan/chitin deacetylase (PgdA/CDA1 family)
MTRGSLAVTIDVDGETGLPRAGAGYAQRLSSRSERRYGLTAGLPRILSALAAARAPATFFLPGLVAERHTEVVRGILAGGHELALHGHTHRRLDEMTADEQREDLELGIAALVAHGGGRPEGYRAPAWELTPTTLRLLGEHGLLYDSSLMGADRAYRVSAGGRTLVELPVHWTLDDAPHFAAGGDPSVLRAIWRDELAMAHSEERPVVITLHPEITGRPHRLALLTDLLERARALGMEIATLGVLARRSADAGDEL